MARRFIDSGKCTCKPKGLGKAEESEATRTPSLIDILQRIELDPEIENFYPENSGNEDRADQPLLIETDLPWTGLIQECHVCISEKRRYPGCTDLVDCLSSALINDMSSGEVLNEKTPPSIDGVMEGADTRHLTRDKSRTTNAAKSFSSLFSPADKDELVCHKSDLGFQRNFQSRKSAKMRDEKEGCVVNIVSKEQPGIRNRTDEGSRRRTNFQTTDYTSKTTSRSRVNIDMVSGSKRKVERITEQSQQQAGDVNGRATQPSSALRRKESLVNEEHKEKCHDCDINRSSRDENRITTELANGNSLILSHACDEYEMPMGAIEPKRTGIEGQTEDNAKGFAWSARQNKINSAKPEKKVPKCDDTEAMSFKSNMASQRDGNFNRNAKTVGVGFSDVENDIEKIPQNRLSVANGVKPIDECQTVNWDSCIDCTSGESYQKLEAGCLGGSRGTMATGKRADSTRSVREKGSTQVAKDDFLSVAKKSGTPRMVKTFSGNGAACRDGGADAAAVVKPMKSNFARLNGFSIENGRHKKAQTKQPSEAQPESIVNLSIESNEEEGNGVERQNKWMIQIVDHDSRNDNISVVPLKDSAGHCLHDGKGLTCQDSHKDDSGQIDDSPTVDETRKTIKCLGNLNPVLENRRPARKSIEKGQSQKCIVNGDFQGLVTDDLSSSIGKMWRKNSLSNDASKQAQSNAETSKLFYQGQGVQFRLNIKKPAVNLSNEPKNEEAEAAGETENRTKRVVSTAKSVSVKSLLKTDKIEEKFENKREISGKETCSSNYDDTSEDIGVDNDLMVLDDQLPSILNYEPPKLKVPVVGKGRIEFELKGIVDEEKLKMENARLSKLLLEVEQARSTTVKALLSANTVLHKVNDANSDLEGRLKTLGTDKKFLEMELNEYKQKLRNSDNQKDIFSTTKATEFESSMKVIIGSWKKEKQELLSALAKSSLRVQRVEADAEGLRAAFQKVKDQLENSNATFNKLLEHNLQASVRVEEELQCLKEEKAMLNDQIAQGNGEKMKMGELEDEISEYKSRLESSNDEKEELYRKIGHLEKKNKQFRVECEELQEQLDHSQEIVDKLAEKEEELKGRLGKETSEKEYLQGCLDETGQILLHLRNNEKKLLDEKDELEEDLEEEMQVNESLQQSLKSTMKEHLALVNRLEDITNVHLNVKESLDQASKKERTYQQQITSLNKTNSILHYSLDKEKEEKMDLEEMYENLESRWKIHKHERMLEVMDLKKNLEDLTETETEARSQNERLVKESEHLRVSLEHEEEENEGLRKKVARLEQWKETNETDFERVRNERDTAQNENEDLRKRVEDLKKGLEKEKGRYNTLMCTLEDTEESLDKALKDFSGARDQAGKLEREVEELKAQVREKTRKVRELEILLGEERAGRDGLQSKLKSSENERNKLKKSEEKCREEIETSQMQVRRLEREKLCVKKSLDESRQEFDMHKERCVENFQKLREELVGVQNQLVEKDRQAMKQKENWQDAMENTAADLKLLRDLLGGDMNYKSMMQGSSLLREVLARDGGADIDYLRRAYQRAESELMRDVCDLEGMLKVSKEQKNTVAIVKSPMSKIKLSEIKKLRDEMYEIHNELFSVKSKMSSIVDEVLTLKKGEKHGDYDNKTVQSKSEAILQQLKELDATITKIESDHEFVLEKNNGIINKSIAHVSRENTIDELDSSGESAYEGEEGESARKEAVDSQLVAENERLKQDIELLKRKYQTSASNGNENEERQADKMVANNSNAVGVEDTSSARPTTVQKYIPPTSMRYPPKSGGGPCGYNSATGQRSGYLSNDSESNDRGRSQANQMNLDKVKKPSYFTAEMSLFHHDESVAANILRRKLQSKHYLRETKSDTGSVRSSGSFKGDILPKTRCHRSGSVDDDDENDEDSDMSAGELRRSKTLPRRVKSRPKFV